MKPSAVIQWLLRFPPNSSLMEEIKGISASSASEIAATQLAQSKAQVSELTDKIDQQARIFDGIFSSISDFAYAFDRDGRFVFINKALLDLWGMSLAEAVGKNFHELPYPEELATTLQRQIQEVFDTGERVVDETFYTNPEGITGYYEYIFSPVRDAEGNFDMVSGSTRDITARKNVERRLAESEEQYRTLFDSIDEGFCIAKVVFDDNQKPLDYVFLEVNPSFVKQTGLLDPVGKGAREMVPNHEELWFEIYGDIALTGKPRRFEQRAEALGRWYDVYAFRIGDPSEHKLAIIFNDIVDRKRAEEEIRLLNEKNREVLESITDAFFALDGEWKFVYVNKQAEELLSREPGDLIGRSIWDEYPGLIGSEFETAYRKAANDRIASTVTSYYQDHQRWYEVTTYPAESGITVYFRNATERVARDEALRHSESELRAMDRRKDEFIATLAHELRNPLAPIRSGLEVIRSSNNDPALTAKMLDMIQRQTNHIVRLVDDLLDVSRITQGKINLQKERFELRQAIDMAIETSKKEIEASGNELLVTLPYKPIYLDADLTRISQIFLNILNNAAKFSSAGGTIRIEVDTQGGDAVICIRDQGRGIAPESLPKIFEIFGQVDTSERRDRAGLGIGLSVVKQLAEMHGGSIEARSEGLGKGSEFIVRLPIASAGSDELIVPKTVADGNGSLSFGVSRKILVVDDNHDAATMMETLLQLHGHNVRKSFDGVTALNIAHEFKPDICLLDIGMPGMSGHELATEIRRFLPNSLLISVSGWGQETDRIRSRESGFDHHLVKPVEFTSLFALIDEHSPIKALN